MHLPTCDFTLISTLWVQRFSLLQADIEPGTKYEIGPDGVERPYEGVIVKPPDSAWYFIQVRASSHTP